MLKFLLHGRINNHKSRIINSIIIDSGILNVGISIRISIRTDRLIVVLVSA